MNRRTWVCFVVLLCAILLTVPAMAQTALYQSGANQCLLSENSAGGAATKTAANAINFGYDLSNMDKSVKPCTDFYQYACGGWLAKNPIPAAYPAWGSFSELAQKNQDVLHEILEHAAKNTKAPKDSDEQKIGAFYGSCMDAPKIEAEGDKPLQPEFDRIAAIKDVPSLEKEIVHLQRMGVGALFFFRASQDLKNATRVIGNASQGGLGLPDRDYYMKNDPRSEHIRSEYEKHVANMLELLGDKPDQAATEAKSVLKIETELAKASMTRVERRNPNAQYHMMTLTELHELTPDFSWPEYFQGIGHPGLKEINIGQPDFFKAMNAQLKSVPIDEWKTYLRWHLISATAPFLSDKFVTENFHFNGAIMTGTKEILPRWKRCVQTADRALGEIVGKFYVQKNFPPAAKAHALIMVHNLEAALQSDLSTLSWMDPATRQKAIAKLDAYMNKIGYPDKWRDYSALHVNRGVYIDNIMRANVFARNYNLEKIGKPVDRTEWGMTPPTVNAYYNPAMNEIVFPAGILQPPFYSPKADDAVNYGGMGAVIGHEMTHGFDDEGRKFDAHGNLTDWWTPADAEKFKAKAECVEKQFDSYAPLPGEHVNGKLVLGESIADLGGLTISLAAYEKSIAGKPRHTIDGFTPEQRFFLGWAQVWCENTRPEFARLMLKTNPHPPNQFRAIGPPSNMPAFAKAFDCKAGDAMVRPPENQCKIW